MKIKSNEIEDIDSENDMEIEDNALIDKNNN